jgi:hypothetical protein
MVHQASGLHGGLFERWHGFKWSYSGGEVSSLPFLHVYEFGRGSLYYARAKLEDMK